MKDLGGTIVTFAIERLIRFGDDPQQRIDVEAFAELALMAHIEAAGF